MANGVFEGLQAEIGAVQPIRRIGRVVEVGRGTLRVSGLQNVALGDRVQIRPRSAPISGGEILRLGPDGATVLPDSTLEGITIADPVEHLGPAELAPHEGWLGRIVDPFGKPLDGRPLLRGPSARPLRAAAPPAASRHLLGARLETGVAVFNTLLPIVRGQRLGLFAGSGIGKTTLLGKLARGVAADVVVIALIGERGRELRDFVEKVLGPEGMARAVLIVATSDQSPLVRRQTAWAAMAVAEFFRDQGQQVLLLADSVTRFAEAHREVALAAGEPASLRGYPASVAHMIMSLAERAGPGCGDSGDITALFTVLVAGSDMEEPIADILRGVLDGHVVMDRAIAERGRFPAIDVLRSVSRSLPEAASDDENRLISETRSLLSTYDRAEMMIQAGLYVPGSDAMIDRAVRLWKALDGFLAEDEPGTAEDSFARLAAYLAGRGPS
ncbi:FliI/YscN family ATPase [Plastorhodobacter daqingensis]|uniref:FliI/YscN family ATPase n=1 Tax=Plastorhodobacter daqingensis TaxID=1387281 RepID=A0ABW2UF55_9RHOB